MNVRILLIQVLISVVMLACTANRGNVSEAPVNQNETRQKVTREGSSRQNNTEESTTSGDIYIAVDNSLRPAIQSQINSFMGSYAEATIRPIFLPGEEAISNMLESDSVRLVITTRKLTEEEEKILEYQHTFADYSEVAKEGIAFLAHEDNPLDTLTTDDLYDLISGKVHSWKQIDAESEFDDMKIVFDNARSSTVKFIQDSLLEGNPIAKEKFFALDSTLEVINYVKDHPDALGIVGFSWISDGDDPKVKDAKNGINILAIGGIANDSLCPYDHSAFGPYQSYLTTDCYPLVRSIYTVRREVNIGLGTGFIAFLAGPRGQRIFHKHGIAAIKGISRQVKFPRKERARDPLKAKAKK